MLYLTMFGHFETTSVVPGCEHVSGSIVVKSEPPSDLEDPNHPNHHLLSLDLVMIDIDPNPKPFRNTWRRLINKTAHWDNTNWTITGVDPVDDGQCIIYIERQP